MIAMVMANFARNGPTLQRLREGSPLSFRAGPRQGRITYSCTASSRSASISREAPRRRLSVLAHLGGHRWNCQFDRFVRE